MLRRGLATRELSPAVELAALEAAPEQNYRPAARRLWQWCRVRVSHWVVWSCVQYYGHKLQEQEERDWWPEKALKRKTGIVVTEIDTAILRTQRWGEARRGPEHFGMHVGVHYTGREPIGWLRRKDVRLCDKTVLVSTGGIGTFGNMLRKQRDRHYGGGGYLSVMLSDGDEGLKWVREREFPNSVWLLDRWHIAEKVRTYVGNNDIEYARIMRGVYECRSEAVLEAIRTSDQRLQQRRPREFRELFGYVLGNREGIEAYRQIPKKFRRSVGRKIAAVRAGSGVIEKQVEVQVNRRFKWQGRSWSPIRADRLAQLAWLQRDRTNWRHWWDKQCLSTTRVNPSWDP
jgi:hypothetical protein